MRIMISALAMLLLALPIKMTAQKQFTLEDLNFGGSNYRNMRPATASYHWEGDRLVEGKKADTKGRLVVKDYNLFADDRQITFDGSRDIVYGQAVHRNEFGIETGLFPSPDGEHTAFYRMDQSMVSDYPQVNYNPRIAQMEPDRYPMAGETSHKVTVGLYHFPTQQLVYLDLGDVTDRYFTNITWSPDSRLIYLIELNRDQTDMSLDVYDATNGKKLRTIYREHDDRYAEPLHPIVFLPWDNKKFIMQSQRDGYNHLYIYAINGKEIRSLKNADYIVTDFYGFCTSRKTAIVQAVKSDEMDYSLYSVNLKNGRWTCLDNGKGYHTGTLSQSGEYVLDSWSAPDVPHNIDVVNTITGKRENKLTASDPWQGYIQPIFRSGRLKAADNSTNLFWRMVLPPDFDAKKKYPAVVYVYGGPHARNVSASWHYGYRGWEPYMAQKGYIVFVLDNRGSADRGRDFEQVTFRHLGQEEMKDQMCGVNFLRSLPYVDAGRLGVHGWSFGGFMTLSLLLNYPDVFKVGVAGGPVIDWKYYEVMYGERYMDTPQANPDGYTQTSLLGGKVEKLQAKTLLIIGANDRTVVPQHSYLFLKEAIDHNKPIDFFAYPEEEHNMKGHRSVHLHEKITQYFLDFL